MTDIVDPGKFGFSVPTFRPWLKCDIAVVKGGCYIMDNVGNSSLVEGEEGYAFGHVIASPNQGTIPDAAGRFDRCCWAESDGAAGDIVRFTVQGVLSVKVPTATVKDDVLVQKTGGGETLDLADGSLGRNIVAQAMEAEPGVDGVGFATCYVSGWWPLGFDGSSFT